MSVPTVESLELSQIVPSSTNPRKSFDPIALEQLAESMKQIGVTVPILVRPLKAIMPGGARVTAPHQWELVSGHRRLKAAAIAGLETIPAFIRELTDAEALDIQMVENLQRADLHPMEEAAGYQALIDAAAERGVALTQEELAHKVGKPLSYVAQRAKLLDLAATPRKIFQEGHINIGHALVLAKLTPELQADGLRKIFDPNNTLAKVKDVAAVVEKAIERAADPKQYNGPRDAAIPVSSLKSWVKYEVELNLGEAPWDLAADNLHPKAGSCNACPKRTTNNPALFSEMTAGEDKCMDPECFDVKSKTFVHITVNGPTETGKPMLRLSNNWDYAPLDGTEKAIKSGQWEKAEKGSCPDAREGVMVQGNETGTIRWVCINQKCKVHKHTVRRPEPAQSSSSQPKAPKGMTLEEHKAQQQRDEKRAKAERMAWYLALREAYANEVGREAAMLEYIARSIDGMNSEDPSLAYELNGWKQPGDWQKSCPFLVEKLTSLKGDQFVSYLFDLMYGDMSDADGWRDFTKELSRLTEKYAVDQKAVLAKVKAANPELYDVPKPKEPEKAKGKPATKKAAKKVAKKTAAKKSSVSTRTAKEQQAEFAAADRKSAAAGDVDEDDDLPDFGDPKDEADDRDPDEYEPGELDRLDVEPDEDED